MQAWGSQQGWGQPLYDDRGAPRGYGQQSGQSPFLDRSRRSIESALEEPPDQAPVMPAPAWRGYQTPVPPTPTGGTSTGKTLEELQAEWDEEYRQLVASGAIARGEGMNRQRPGTEGSVDPRIAPPQSGYGPGGVANPGYVAPNLPGATPGGGGGGYQATPGGPVDRSKWAGAAQAATHNNYSDIDLGGHRLSTGGYLHQLEGMGDLASTERGSETLKRQMARIMSRYDVNQAGAIERLVADEDFRALFPNARVVEGGARDKIDFGMGGGPVDIMRAGRGDGSGEAWQWDPGSGAGGYGGQGGPQAVAGALTPPTAPAGEGLATPGGVAQTVGLPTGGLTPDMLLQLLEEPASFNRQFY